MSLCCLPVLFRTPFIIRNLLKIQIPEYACILRHLKATNINVLVSQYLSILGYVRISFRCWGLKGLITSLRSVCPLLMYMSYIRQKGDKIICEQYRHRSVAESLYICAGCSEPLMFANAFLRLLNCFLFFLKNYS